MLKKKHGTNIQPSARGGKLQPVRWEKNQVRGAKLSVRTRTEMRRRQRESQDGLKLQKKDVRSLLATIKEKVGEEVLGEEGETGNGRVTGKEGVVGG